MQLMLLIAVKVYDRMCTTANSTAVPSGDRQIQRVQNLLANREAVYESRIYVVGGCRSISTR